MKHTIYTLVLAIVATALLSACGGAKLATADEQMARGEYFNASKTYRKIYNKLTAREDRELRGQVAFRMAECHRCLNQYARAAAAYQNAARYGYPDSTLYLRLGQMQQASGNYSAAVRSYEDYLAWRPGDELARNSLAGAQTAAARTGGTRYIVRPARLFNSRRSDFSPMYADDGNLLYFTTTNEKVTGEHHSEITGMKKGDIWVASKNERGEWRRPEPAEGELNTDADEGTPSFSPDGSTMYLSRARREPASNTGVEIYTSQRSDARWSAPVKFEITPDTLSSYAHPAVSPDGTWLYFSSDMPGGSGGRDIWRINLRERGGSLENMGEWINTPGDEMFPYVRSDSVIYFASNGHPGYGGLDIFRAELTRTGGWSVTNMGTPVNSASDDFGITFAPGTESGFFSSNRTDARGYDHLFSFELPELKILITGWVLDRDEEPVPNAVIRIVGNDGSNQKQIARPDGSFSFPLDRGVTYVMLAGARGYLNQRQEFTSDTAEEDAEYNIDFILASATRPVVIDNIFYDYDKATLRPESREALDEMVRVLNDNPNVTIEMASHTDRHGSDQYNIGLSSRRARAVIDYLITAGIDAERLQSQGYGKSRPKTITRKLAREFPQFPEGTVLTEEYILTLTPENQAVADQINRRTEFQVLSLDYQRY